ncbi:hypothetical protein DW964_06715 [Ruminococcus sp. AM47-2BH]|nr:hypothetical protein DW964_06715 [Ruminococcus sp. AM47-2BH]
MDEERVKKATGLEKLIVYVRKHFWTWFIYAITTSLILLVAFSLIYDKNIELSIINSWVGIILGLVALVATVFSLGLSFYNFDKQNELDTQNQILMNKILNNTAETKEQLVKYGLSNNSIKIQSQDDVRNKTDLDKISKALTFEINNKGDGDD